MSQVEDVCGVDGYRCEECTHCARTKPCECGCGLLGGTCEEWQLECSECGETMPNNLCEFVNMDDCMCNPCATTLREKRMNAIEEYQKKTYGSQLQLGLAILAACEAGDFKEVVRLQKLCQNKF